MTMENLQNILKGHHRKLSHGIILGIVLEAYLAKQTMTSDRNCSSGVNRNKNGN